MSRSQPVDLLKGMDMSKPVVHKTSYYRGFGGICGVEPKNGYNRKLSRYQWKYVTCKRCLAKRPKENGDEATIL